MALIKLGCFSDTLQLDISVTLIFPQKCDRSPDIPSGPYKVLYLLHGLKQNETSYVRNSMVERYVRDLPLVVVMPAVGRSFYTDQDRGYPYFTFLTEELPSILSTMFNISTKREDTYIAGLSMGGYGAFKAALKRPDLYAKAASMSGALDLVALTHKMADVKQPFGSEWENTFGDLENVADGPHDLFALARANSITKPELYVTCGDDDFLLEDNQHFVEIVRQSYQLTYEQFPGAHTWDFWDTALIRIVRWLFPIEAAI